MTSDEGRKPEGAPERSAKLSRCPSGVDGNGTKRFSVQRKMAIVARLLRGEPLELVVRETNVSIARLSEWHDRALAGAATALNLLPVQGKFTNIFCAHSVFWGKRPKSVIWKFRSRHTSKRSSSDLRTMQESRLKSLSGRFGAILPGRHPRISLISSGCSSRPPKRRKTTCAMF
jgi:hypothetical protein